MKNLEIVVNNHADEYGGYYSDTYFNRRGGYAICSSFLTNHFALRRYMKVRLIFSAEKFRGSKRFYLTRRTGKFTGGYLRWNTTKSYSQFNDLYSYLDKALLRYFKVPKTGFTTIYMAAVPIEEE